MKNRLSKMALEMKLDELFDKINSDGDDATKQKAKDEYENLKDDLRSYYTITYSVEAGRHYLTRIMRSKLTREELSRIRSIAGRRGGRPKGSGKGRMPTKTITVREPDYNILVAYADLREFSISEGIHRLCVGLTKKYEELKKFAPVVQATN